MPPPPLRFVEFRRANAATNMAADADLAACAKRAGAAVLRFYEWNEEAFTFGYGQRYAEVEAFAREALGASPAAVLVRRPTGGGVVDHRDDLTYALALPGGHPAVRLAPARFYRILHGALAEALASLGLAVALAPEAPGRAAAAFSGPTAGAPAACFADQPAPADVLLAKDAGKLAGAALRRSPHGLLAQGSLARRSLPRDLDAGTLRPAFAGALADAFALAPAAAPLTPPAPWPDPAKVLHFASAAWNRRR